MSGKKFDPKKIHILNDPARIKDYPLDLIFKKIGTNELDIMADIGAGTGFFAAHILEYLGRGKVFACDVSDIMVNWMRQNLCHRYKNIYPIKMQECEIPIKDNIVDLVYMINLHHELDCPEKLLKECHRILKQGKKLCIIDWKKGYKSEGPPQHLRYDLREVEEQMLGSGFKDISVSNDLEKHFMVIGEK